MLLVGGSRLWPLRGVLLLKKDFLRLLLVQFDLRERLRAKPSALDAHGHTGMGLLYIGVGVVVLAWTGLCQGLWVMWCVVLLNFYKKLVAGRHASSD